MVTAWRRGWVTLLMAAFAALFAAAPAPASIPRPAPKVAALPLLSASIPTQENRETSPQKIASGVFEDTRPEHARWFALYLVETQQARWLLAVELTPEVREWLSRDPLGEQGGLNLTAFCGNDPVNNIDPDGRYFGYIAKFWADLARRLEGETRYTAIAFPLDLYATLADRAAMMDPVFQGDQARHRIKEVGYFGYASESVGIPEASERIGHYHDVYGYGWFRATMNGGVADPVLDFIGLNDACRAIEGYTSTGDELETWERWTSGFLASAKGAGTFLVLRGSLVSRSEVPSWQRGPVSEVKPMRPSTRSLSPEAARQYYNNYMPNFRYQLLKMQARGATAESIARRASHMRNALAQRTRDAMADRALAESLRPHRPIEYYIEKYSAEGFTGDALWQRITEGALTPNPEVNAALGITGPENP